MNVASKELCEELYELSGWEFDESHRRIEKVWIQSFSTSEMGQGHDDYEKTPPSERRQYHIGEWVVRDNPKNFIGIPEDVPWGWANKYYQKTVDASVPAYDLGYLLRKLPMYLEIKHPDTLRLTIGAVIGGRWCASYDWEDGGVMHEQFQGTPEDAACKLAIELFKPRHSTNT